jgi:hypothetical protein
MARGRSGAEALRIAAERKLRWDRWREGERLPTERETERDLEDATRRPTTRRGARCRPWKASGSFIRHVGRGTFKATGAASPSLTPGPEELEGASPVDVLECRSPPPERLTEFHQYVGPKKPRVAQVALAHGGQLLVFPDTPLPQAQHASDSKGTTADPVPGGNLGDPFDPSQHGLLLRIV